MHRYMHAGKHIDIQINTYLHLNVFIHVFIHSYTKYLQKLPPYTELHTYTKTSISHPSLYTCCMCYICIQTIREQIQIKQSSNYDCKPQTINICVF